MDETGGLMMKALTARQAAVLEMIEKFLSVHGRPPTRQEMADHFGWSSPNAAQDYIKVLAKKGAIEWTNMKSRGVKAKRPNDWMASVVAD